MQSTKKSVLTKELESRIKTDDPPYIDASIIDGMFFLHLLVELPGTFGLISKHIFKRLCNFKGKQIHVAFDKIFSPSIKDCERNKRMTGDRNTEYQLTGHSQKRPGNWLDALRNDNFKKTLIEYLISSWEDDSLSSILGDKTIVVNKDDVCYSFSVRENKIIKTGVDTMYCTYEEADSRMLFHLKSLSSISNVVLRTSDTDVLVIALSCWSHFNDDINLWLEVDLSGEPAVCNVRIHPMQLHGISACIYRM